MIYRGFDIEFNGAVWQIFERGKLIDDAATETAAEDRVNLILLERRAEDRNEITRGYGRLA